MRYFINPYDDAAPHKLDASEIQGQIFGYLRDSLRHVKPDARNVDGGLYVGISGIAYALYYVANNLQTSESPGYFKKALEYLKPALVHRDREKTSFLLGDLGTQAVSAAAFHKNGDVESSAVHIKNFQESRAEHLLKCGSDELFVGRAGYIAGMLWLKNQLQNLPMCVDSLFNICNVIVASGRVYSKQYRSPCPLMYAYYNTEYLGAGHGLSFILQMLITVPGYLQQVNTTDANDIKASIDYLLSLQNKEGNWPCATDEIRLPEYKLVHWCHGAPGIIYLMARAWLVYKEKKYLDSCILAADLVWRKGLLRKGPGICHGVAGNGYVFLLMYRLTNDDKYLNRAHAFARFLKSEQFLREARTPDCPYSLYEGTAGTVCFLVDLLNPHRATFPFMDVFDEISG